MSVNELSVTEYVYYAVARGANPRIIRAVEAFMAAAPTAKPDLSQVSRNDLRSADGFALHQKIIPLNFNAFQALENEHLVDLDVQTIKDKALIALSRRIAEAGFYKENIDSSARSYGPEIDHHIFTAVADLAEGDGFEKEVGMARNFVVAAQQKVVEYNEAHYRSPSGSALIPVRDMKEVTDTVQALRDKYLTGQFEDTLKSTALTALETTAIDAALSGVKASPKARVAALG